MSQKLSLEVKLPLGTDKQKTFEFQSSTAIKDAVAEIVRDQDGRGADLYTLASNNKGICKHYNPSSTFEACGIDSKTPLELCFRYALVQTTFHDGGEFRLKRIAYPFFDPLETWLPYLGHKFGLTSTEGFALKFVGKSEDLDVSQSLEAQGYQEGTRILFYEVGKRLDITSMRIFHDIQERQHDRGTKQKSEMDFSMDDLLPSDLDLEAPANTLLMNLPKANGFLSVLNKKKKWDRWFSILIGNHLFYYKSQHDSKPTQVLNLVHYNVTHLDDKKKKVPQGFIEITHENGKEVIVNKADTGQWHTQWLENLRKCCEEARLEREKKIAEKTSGKEGVGAVFCRPLEDQVQVKDGSELPKIVPKCIEYIEERALDVEGIFRLSGSAVLIQEYKQRFDAGEDVSFENESDPHAVAGLFKLYFRELPAPVMTWEHYDDFIIAESIPNEGLRLRYLRYLIDNKLPPISRALLRRLVSFLRKVNEHSEVNKMPIHNIATVFGPNLLRQQNANMLQMVEDTAQINNIVNLLINHDGYLLNGRPLPETVNENDMTGVYAKSNFEFIPENPETDLTLKRNDIINVIIQGIDGWWKGELNGHFGKFPGSYVSLLTGEELKKNLRRARFKQELFLLRQQDVDEDVTLARLQSERQELLETQKELNAQWVQVESVFKVLADQIIDTCGEGKCEQFAAKMKKLLECSATYNLVHDDLADARYDLMNQLNELKTACTSDKDKKKKVDKKQEKIQEQTSTLLSPILEQFNKEKPLHHKNVKLEADIMQTLQAVDQVGHFLAGNK